MTIKELVGNVATKEDRISIAHVNVTNPASEPWLTLHYDEYICVLKGKIEINYEDDEKNLQILCSKPNSLGKAWSL